jgi:hypothetical protein
MAQALNRISKAIKGVLQLWVCVPSKVAQSDTHQGCNAIKGVCLLNALRLCVLKGVLQLRGRYG